MSTPGNPAGPARASSLPPLPQQRPTWMVVLASLMVVFAFYLFLEGAAGLTRGAGELIGATPAAGVAPAAGTPEAAELALWRSLGTVLKAAIDPWLWRLYAGSKLVFAAVLIYAVAAIVTRDRRGRRGVLIAAWVGIGYHLLVAVFRIAVVRTGLLAGSEVWLKDVVAAMGARPEARALTPEEIRAWADALMVVVPLAAALVGVGFSLILMTFFGGGRGRDYYGLPRGGVGEAGPRV
jgi:hypothetical protein